MSPWTAITGWPLRGLALSLLAVASLSSSSHADDDKAVKQVEKLDAQFVKALTELAKSYDDKKIPEAAHFFASCALGFGGKDEKLALIKGGWEGAVYLGKLRGGDPIKETAPITSALGSLSTAYKKILDPWIAKARKNDLPESLRKLMLDTGIKYELARSAHEYVQAVQRCNVLRKEIGLRAVLWDSEMSIKFIQAAWYTGETTHHEYKSPKRESPFYASAIDDAEESSRGPILLKEYPSILRTYALVRQDLLNPNARLIRLGHWNGGLEIQDWAIYSIPQLPYRSDIPTPTQRFKNETVVEGWVEIEDHVVISGKKVPYVRYPYSQEPNVPRVFSNGRGAMEAGGWAKSEHDFLEKAGIPIILRFFCEGDLTEVEAELKDSSDRKRSCRLYQTGDKRIDFHRPYSTILLVPERHLDPSTRYTVQIQCKLDSAPIHQAWSFTTTSD